MVYYIILSNYIIMISSINLSGIRMRFYQHITWLTIISVVSMAFLKVSEPLAGIVIVVMVTIMMLKAKVKLIESICYSVFSMLLSVISDSIVSVFIFRIFKNRIQTTEQLRQDVLLYAITGITIFIMVYAISNIIGILIHKRIKRNPLNIKNKFSMLIAICIIITFVVIYINAFIGKDDYNSILLTSGMYIIYFILLMTIIFVLFWGYFKDEKVKSKQREIEQLDKYTNNLEIAYKDMRKVRHDYMNVLVSMIGYMDNNDMPGLVNFFEKEIIPFSNKLRENNFKLGLLARLKQRSIKGIVSMKVIQAQEAGIKVFIDIAEDFEITHMDIIDLCRILGILLDNAIEAAKEYEVGKIKVGFINKPKVKTIVIINSCKDDLPLIYKLYEQGFSTKGKGRGLGLSNLKEIMDAYSNTTIDTVVENNEFRQVIEIMD